MINTAPIPGEPVQKTIWYVKLWEAYRRQKHRVDGLVIGAGGIAVLVWVEIISSSRKNPPSGAELGVLLAAAAVLQVWAGTTFGKIGRVDAEKAKSAVRRLFTLGGTIGSLQTELRDSLESDDARRHRDSVIRADEALNAVGSHLENAISDWTDVHPEALKETIDLLVKQRQQSIDQGRGYGDE